MESSEGGAGERKVLQAHALQLKAISSCTVALCPAPSGAAECIAGARRVCKSVKHPNACVHDQPEHLCMHATYKPAGLFPSVL